MNERIKSVRKALKLSQDAFGEKLGMTGGGVSLLELGKRSVTEQVIKSICREFNVDYLWLTTGEGEMFTDLPASLLDELASKYDLTDEEKTIVHDFLSLTKDERKIVMNFLRPVK